MALHASPRLALALACLARLLPAAADLAELVTLTDYVAATGARCLDGSPYEIWISRKPASRRFVLDIQGGAWCGSVGDCESRAYNPSNCYLGSSRPDCFNVNAERCANKSDAMTFECIPACNGARWCGGLFKNDTTRNPLTAEWTKVLFPYHDGGSFAGDNDTVTPTPSGPLYFRGHRNFLAAIDYLVKHEGLGDAIEVVLTGNSAGGLATYFHMDELAALLPGVRVSAAPDSGFFYATDPGHPSWGAELLDIVEFMNATAGLDQSCVAALRAAGGDPATCSFPEVLAPHLMTPLFVINGRFDPALDSISAGESEKNMTHVREIGARFLGLVQSTLLQPGRGNAAFITSCAQHCGQWSQGADGDFNVSIDGDGAVEALMKWREGTKSLWVQAADFPCATCCSGGQA